MLRKNGETAPCHLVQSDPASVVVQRQMLSYVPIVATIEVYATARLYGVARHSAAMAARRVKDKELSSILLNINFSVRDFGQKRKWGREHMKLF